MFSKFRLWWVFIDFEEGKYRFKVKTSTEGEHKTHITCIVTGRGPFEMTHSGIHGGLNAATRYMNEKTQGCKYYHSDQKAFYSTTPQTAIIICHSQLCGH